MLTDLPFISIIRRLIKNALLHSVRQILLLYIVFGIIMGVTVTGPMAQLFRSFIVLVL